MPGQLISIASIDGIYLDQRLREVQSFNDSIFISTRNELIDFVSKLGEKVIGYLPIQELVSEPTPPNKRLFVVSRREIDTSKEVITGEYIDTLTYEAAKDIVGFLTPWSVSLWCIKDCTFWCQQIYQLYIERLTERKLGRIYPVQLLYYNATGEASVTSFSERELVSACEIFEQVVSKNKTQERIENRTDRKSLWMMSRHNRAWHLVQAARKQNLLSYRIASYMTCFESLLSRDNQEMTHKVAERAALLLGYSSKKQQQIFERTKKAYSIRSMFVHGHNINQSDEDLTEISIECDNNLRQLLGMTRNGPQYPFLFEDRKNDEFSRIFMNRLFD
ncbi:hypothetical protein KKC97_11395 [bacterium]|nr:hypothetical protein [bacterium]